MKKLSVVAIIGRVNVGKSTLLNRLVGETRAIVSRLPGTTRDKIQAKCVWGEQTFELIDTGGLIAESKTGLEKNIKLQTEKALKLANIILFLVDVREGINPQDLEIVKGLRKSKKKVILAVNKVDDVKYRTQVPQFYKLGLGKPWPVSAIQGVGCGDLLDKILKELPKYKSLTFPEDEGILNEPFLRGLIPRRKVRDKEVASKVSLGLKIIKTGICGKINVGKSSLFNCFLQREEVIVSKEPGTTRDITYAVLKYKGQKIELADSAGIKRKAKIKEEIERIVTRQSLNLIKRSNIILFVLDGLELISRQDMRLANFVVKNKKSAIIVVNKWDLSKKGIAIDQYVKYLQNRSSFLFWAPVIFVSAKTGENVRKILDLVLKVTKEKEKVISEENLKDFLQNLLEKHPPKASISKIVQTKTALPQFTIHIRPKQPLAYPYLRFFEKQLRAKFGFKGVPIKLEVKSK